VKLIVNFINITKHTLDILILVNFNVIRSTSKRS